MLFTAAQVAPPSPCGDGFCPSRQAMGYQGKPGDPARSYVETGQGSPLGCFLKLQALKRKA